MTRARPLLTPGKAPYPHKARRQQTTFTWCRASVPAFGGEARSLLYGCRGNGTVVDACCSVGGETAEDTGFGRALPSHGRLGMAVISRHVESGVCEKKAPCSRQSDGSRTNRYHAHDAPASSVWLASDHGGADEILRKKSPRSFLALWGVRGARGLFFRRPRYIPKKQRDLGKGGFRSVEFFF